MIQAKYAMTLYSIGHNVYNWHMTRYGGEKI
jgi:hypothetical protein